MHICRRDIKGRILSNEPIKSKKICFKKVQKLKLREIRTLKQQGNDAQRKTESIIINMK